MSSTHPDHVDAPQPIHKPDSDRASIDRPNPRRAKTRYIWLGLPTEPDSLKTPTPCLPILIAPAADIPPGLYDINTLIAKLHSAKFEAGAFLRWKERTFAELAVRMLSSTPAPPATLLRFLVRWKTPPEKGARLDGPVRSFVANKQLLLDALRAARTSMHSVAYHATSIALTAGSEVDELTVTNIRDPNTIPSREDPPPAANTATGAVIIPHRGPAGLLSTCLHYITRQPSPKPNVTVAFDEPLRPQLNALMRRYPQAAFYKSEPVHAGPYPARQQLAVQSTEEFLFFQDSDDASCTNRLSRLAAELTATHSDMLGSHELRFNEIRGTLSIRRFPLNVREALARAPSSALLFPSTCVRRQAFLASGGLSTASRFGTDTQFILRSYFSMESIRNVDEILYIRRIRNGSLTTAPATGLENPVRTARRKAWQQDFHRAMFSNSIDRDSTLRPQHRKSPIKLTRLDTEVGSIRPRRISKRE